MATAHVGACVSSASLIVDYFAEEVRRGTAEPEPVVIKQIRRIVANPGVAVLEPPVAR